MESVRVLHSVTKYLNLTENWIEPQVFRVPGAEGRVICDARANEAAFPASPDALIIDPQVTEWHWRQRAWLARRADRRGANRAWSAWRARRWRPHLVHGHFGPRAWASRNLAARMNVPLVTSFYGYDAWMAPRTEPIWIDRYRDLFGVGALFLVEGPAMRDRLEALGCPPSKVRVHRIGVDLDGLTFRARAFAPVVTVAMVGRFVEKKGLADGLRACAAARARGLDLRVTIVGDSAPNDSAGQSIAEALRALADGPELAGRVHFTGFISADETRSVLASHDVFLCPSRHAADGDAEGGSPVALTEAMAIGAYCIGTRHCDIPEVIADGQTGAICEEGDVEGLARALCDIPDNVPRVVQMTREGRRRVEQRFAIERQLAGLGEIYRAVALGAAPGAGARP